jgi:DNA-directed RNA polymerase subunit omega
MLPNPDILNEYEHGRFVLSNLAAKRAKQLSEGAPPLLHVDSTHPLTIALAEIAAGKIKPILAAPGEVLDDVSDSALLIDETVPAELGVLLPALDETEVALVATVEEEHEAEAHDEEGMSLGDLIDDEEEEAVTPVGDDEETLSLSDIADQETEDEEDPHDQDA